MRIEDPNNIALDCELLGTAGGVIIPRIAGTTYAYSIAASNADGVEWTVEVPALNVNMPLPPALPRVRPGVQVATAEGVVGERFPFAGMDIVPVILDNIGVVVHFGAPTLTVPGPGGYDVQAGDRFAFAFWKDVQ